MNKLRFTFLITAHHCIIRRLQILTAFLLLFSLSSIAQEIRITGQVTSEAGEALSGVSVTVKGSAAGTSTNAQGNYSITVPNRNSTLVFSYVGYTAREMRVGSDNTMNVVLSPSAATSSLQEVVVIGYGTGVMKGMGGSDRLVRE